MFRDFLHKGWQVHGRLVTVPQEQRLLFTGLQSMPERLAVLSATGPRTPTLAMWCVLCLRTRPSGPVDAKSLSPQLVRAVSTRSMLRQEEVRSGRLAVSRHLPCRNGVFAVSAKMIGQFGPHRDLTTLTGTALAG